MRSPMPSRLRCPSISLVPIVLLFSVLSAEADESIPATPFEIHPLLLGSSPPAAKVVSLAGEDVDLAAVVTSQPTVLVFYRGGW